MNGFSLLVLEVCLTLLAILWSFLLSIFQIIWILYGDQRSRSLHTNVSEGNQKIRKKILKL